MALSECKVCEGTGVIHRQWKEYITHDMATDACSPEMEGQLIEYDDFEQCSECRDEGKVEEELPLDKK